jgi:hypothetical protein
MSDLLCTCPSEGYNPACPMARGGIGHVKQCPERGGPCPCLPGSIAEAYCAVAAFNQTNETWECGKCFRTLPNSERTCPDCAPLPASNPDQLPD